MPFPKFDPVLIHLGPLAIRWYALAYIAGILLGWRYCVALIRNPRIWAPVAPPASAAQIDDLILWVTLGVIAGGRIGYILFYGRGQFDHDPMEMLRLWHGGMSFHGGMLGVILAIVVFALVNRIDMLRLGDLVAPCVPIGLFFGRLANFINGELWGRPTTLPWGIIFPSAPDALPRHPSQLYEAGLEGIVLFLILRWATHRARWLPKQGALTGLFLMFYGLFRIALETVRNPDIGMPDFPLGLTMGMILSIPMVLIGIGLVARGLRAPPPAAAPAAEQPAHQP
ncbi:MAG: prolipoprotein diacylglyceryl transferase [Caulobacteraceae bacterium]|nr:prolipoprotein diacylglyceryl transferase [Caulobacteraceae bacterium]